MHITDAQAVCTTLLNLDD